MIDVAQNLASRSRPTASAGSKAKSRSLDNLLNTVSVLYRTDMIRCTLHTNLHAHRIRALPCPQWQLHAFDFKPTPSSGTQLVFSPLISGHLVVFFGCLWRRWFDWYFVRNGDKICVLITERLIQDHGESETISRMGLSRSRLNERYRSMDKLKTNVNIVKRSESQRYR